MKNYLYMIALFFLLSNMQAQGQTPSISSGAGLVDFMNSDMDYRMNYEEKYSQIDGTPYADEEFYIGEFRFRNEEFSGVQLRLNSYEGYFEYKDEEGNIKYIDPVRSSIDSVWFETELYVYVRYSYSKRIRSTYMCELYSGETRVYSHTEVILKQAEEATGYEAAKQPQFQVMPATTFVQVGDKAALELKSKKDLEAIFPEAYQKDLQTFVKKNKLKLKKSEDVIRLCRYFDSL